MTENSTDIFNFFILRHFGLICLIFVIFISGLQKLYSFVRIRRHPELREGYPRIILGFLLFMGLPWLIIAMGEFLFGISGLFLLLDMYDLDLLSWVIFVVVFSECVFLFVWVWFRGGGEDLHKYQLLFYGFGSPIIAKIFVTLMLFGGLVALIFLVFTNLYA